ncbi:NAD dehydrogenase [Amylocystis lapponica]|nr:NAD dehydrogenase [Amylocystis lapponica]
MQLKGITTALNGAGRYKYKNPEFAVDYLVVGGGVVGLAVARHLAQRFPSKSTYLVERHSSAGQETSSRNSEVIHAGLYYPAGSLKTQLCLRGRWLMYDHCRKYNVPFRKTGKLVVARNNQRSYVEDLHAKALKLPWPTRSMPGDGPTLPTELISGDDARRMEPDLSKDIAAALWSPETGIVDSHTFMESLEADITSSEGAELVYGTRVVRVDPYSPPSPNTVDAGWVVQTITGDNTEGDSMLAGTVINCSGLSGHLIVNSLLPKESRIPLYYGRGSYASYRGPGVSHISHLIYPCPDQTSHAFQSLGSHLTLDLQGKIRFGPDLDWLQPSSLRDGDGDESGSDSADPDFWHKELIPDDTRLSLMHKAVQEYLPGVVFEGLQPDYCGVRPKLVGPGGGFRDFVFRTDYPDDFLSSQTSQRRKAPMISLLGIESPGLTSSLAIAEMVVEDLLCKKEGQVPE